MKVRNIAAGLILCMAAAGCARYLAEHAEVSSNVNGRELPISSVETKEPKIALTFDVAWESADLEEILDILDEEEVKASFFVTGEWAQSHPDLLRKLAEAGHDIGNHSQTHRSMTGLSKEEKKKEILEAKEAVETATGVRMHFFRAPYDNYDDEVIRTAKALGYETVSWNVDTLDWKDYGKAHILETVKKEGGFENGAIIRAHAGTRYMADALQPLIRAGKEAGCLWVPLSEMVRREAYHLDVTGRQIPDPEN